ncbi:hypothetical protein CYY_006503 [Polysphondylium violaceum]|uniref:MRPL25 domain-containing protein n=1 Tax=Polysphondylium violaceum TaxID=133409 RepID=A0A8J4PQG7_9MYCE|nr:hypothetical protein CYY_006503 [Polysphondylium violaceum]
MANVVKHMINVEALVKFSKPQRSSSGWHQPKISGRQLAVLEKHCTRQLGLEWPLAKEKTPIPERPSKLTIWERNNVLRQRKIQESIQNMPKLLADKIKASREKKKKEDENTITALIPEYVEGGPYPCHLPSKVMALKRKAAMEKEKKITTLLASASAATKKGGKKNK